MGFAVGVCGGFWGMGGGWIITPGLFTLGMPMNMAIGTGLAQIIGQSVASTLRHARLGNVDVKIAFIRIIGSMIGVEVGARLIEYLEHIGVIEKAIGIIYIIVLGAMATSIFVESTRAQHRIKKAQTSDDKDRDVVTINCHSKIYNIRIQPMISFPTSKITSLSIWVVLLVGFITGVLSGTLGVGGGFVGTPMFVYLLGVPTHIAVGTNVLSTLATSICGTFAHGLRQNVDIMVALIMLLGGTVGAQLGAISTKYAHGTQIRWLLGIAITIAFISVIIKLLGWAVISAVLILAMAGSMSIIILTYLIRGVMQKKATRTLE